LILSLDRHIREFGVQVIEGQQRVDAKGFVQKRVGAGGEDLLAYGLGAKAGRDDNARPDWRRFRLFSS
jgi:hypothetical protein